MITDLKNPFVLVSSLMIAVLVIIFSSLLVLKKGFEFSPAPQPVMFITWIEGEVHYTDDSEEWRPATHDTTLGIGDKIRTGINSRVILSTPSKSSLRLDENTEVKIAQISHDNLFLVQNYGRTFHKNPTHDGIDYQIKVLNHTFKGEAMVIDASSNLEANRVNVKVLEGTLNVVADTDNEIGIQQISEGNEITIDPQNNPFIALNSIPEDYFTGEWFTWNQRSDLRLTEEAAPEESELISEQDEVTAQPSTDTKAGSPLPSKAVQPVAAKNCTPFLTARKDNTYRGILLNWTPCNSDDFQFYKLVKSTLNTSPSFPSDTVILSSSNKSQTNAIDQTVAPNRTYYYRVCVVLRLNKLSCGNVASASY